MLVTGACILHKYSWTYHAVSRLSNKDRITNQALPDFIIFHTIFKTCN